MRHFTIANGLWLALYLALVAAIVWSLLGVRERTLVDMATPEAQVEWDQWRQAAEKQATTGPVRRRAPGSKEPPMLVLLRDHFPVMLTASIVFSSLLYGTLMIVLRGAFLRSSGDTAGGKPTAPREPIVRSR